RGRAAGRPPGATSRALRLHSGKQAQTAKKARRPADYTRIPPELHKAVPGESSLRPRPGMSERQNASRDAHTCEGKQRLQRETTTAASPGTTSVLFGSSC